MKVASRRLKTVEETRPGTCPDPACDAHLELPYLCHTCGTLLRDPPGLSHFGRFGLPPRFELDLAELERRYLDLSRRLHPDRRIGKGPQVQARALILSSALNEAYAALKDERLRAEHLLQVWGGPTAEQDKRTPPGFLMEQLELREELEEAKARGDRPRLEAGRAQAHAERAGCLARVRALFATEGFPRPELLTELREQLNVVRYWATLEEELSAALAA